MTGLIRTIKHWLARRKRERRLLTRFVRDRVTEQERLRPTYYDEW